MMNKMMTHHAQRTHELREYMLTASPEVQIRLNTQSSKNSTCSKSNHERMEPHHMGGPLITPQKTI